jgi:hypothetical protein
MTQEQDGIRASLAAMEAFCMAFAHQNRIHMMNAILNVGFSVGFLRGHCSVPDYLTGLLDEFDRITGHTLGDAPAKPVTPADFCTPSSSYLADAIDMNSISYGLGFGDLPIPKAFDGWLSGLSTSGATYTTAGK